MEKQFRETILLKIKNEKEREREVCACVCSTRARENNHAKVIVNVAFPSVQIILTHGTRTSRARRGSMRLRQCTVV